MSRDLVALVVTVEIDVDKWDQTFGPYEAADVIPYVREWLAVSPAATAGCIKGEANVRFRREPTP